MAPSANALHNDCTSGYSAYTCSRAKSKRFLIRARNQRTSNGFAECPRLVGQLGFGGNGGMGRPATDPMAG